MPVIIWIIVLIIAIAFWSWVLYEAWNSPIMPDDYGFEEEDENNKTNNN